VGSPDPVATEVKHRAYIAHIDELRVADPSPSHEHAADLGRQDELIARFLAKDVTDDTLRSAMPIERRDIKATHAMLPGALERSLGSGGWNTLKEPAERPAADRQKRRRCGQRARCDSPCGSM
jgi:hypothetical protein